MFAWELRCILMIWPVDSLSLATVETFESKISVHVAILASSTIASRDVVCFSPEINDRLNTWTLKGGESVPTVTLLFPKETLFLEILPWRATGAWLQSFFLITLKASLRNQTDFFLLFLSRRGGITHYICKNLVNFALLLRRIFILFGGQFFIFLFNLK